MNKYNLSDLTVIQRAIVESTDRGMLVFGSPGSGKTRVLTHRIANLLEKNIFKPHHILAITFTNKAANEMKFRLASMLEGKYTVEEIKKVQISTCHSFCSKMLRSYSTQAGLSKNYSIYDQVDSQKVLEKIIKTNLEINQVKMENKKIKKLAVKYYERITQLKHRCITNVDYEDSKILQKTYYIDYGIYNQYQAELKSSNALDFADLLLRYVLLLENDNTVRGFIQDKYTCIFIDEYQDSNLAMRKLFMLMVTPDHYVLGAGDDDQSIYSFMGARPANILEFPQDFPNVTVKLLNENHRSTQTIVNWSKNLISHNLHRQKKDIRSVNNGFPIQPIVQYVESGYHELLWVGKKILEETQENNYELKDIAILARTHRQILPLKNVLLRMGINFVTADGRTFFNNEFIRHVMAYLKVMANNCHDLACAEALKYPPRHIGDKTIDLLLKSAKKQDISLFALLNACASVDCNRSITCPKLTSSVTKKVIAFTNLFKTLNNLPKEETLSSIVELIITQTRYDVWIAKRSLKKDKNEKAEEKIEELKQFIFKFEEYADEDFVISPAQYKSQVFIEEVALSSEQDNLEDINAVRLMTFHASKGLEFKIVILLDFVTDSIPFFYADGEEAVAEERRLAYVGMTRAQEKLIIMVPRAVFGEPVSPSKFLYELLP